MGALKLVLPTPPVDVVWTRLFTEYLIARRPGIGACVAEQSAAAAFSAMFLLTPYEAVDWWDEALCRRLTASGYQVPPRAD